MIRFECDYLEGAHPAILQKLLETNLEQTPGYGEDAHCERARELIRAACGCPEAAVHFLVGGTQTNTTVIASLLRPHQGVLCAHTGHISVHETGAIEATGHKVLPLPAENGKINAAQVENYVAEHYADPTFEHTVQPGMVYISLPTEVGSLYSKAELTALYDVCRARRIPLFIDGARLGYGLASSACDLTLEEVCHLCDVFYIGGTKVGMLFGEAIVAQNPATLADFRYFIKQRGGMLAKGRLLGLQFETMFEDGLYMQVSRHAISLADRLCATLESLGCDFLGDSPTNQLFPIVPDSVLPELEKDFTFSRWLKVDETHTAIRFCISWATTEENVAALEKKLREIL